ncbi:hypothetical protein F4818DRAFT_72481 [Hypoxylon cercidicola]|nr:hypothetical protein F4818DRAFT_72481 [Hypoxylon cercidicola]
MVARTQSSASSNTRIAHQTSFPPSSTNRTSTTPATPPSTTRRQSTEESEAEHIESATPAPAPIQRRRTISLGGIKTSFQLAWNRTRQRLSSMSERPLESIKRATMAADRASHLRKKNIPRADPIDVLDDTGIGGAYHHDGPYDATLASRNKDKRVAPVEAVKYGNSEALKATPRENVLDSLERHVPLQGTANIPPGQRDMSGRLMQYEEGADVMRETDAPGGPYRRYDGINYHPDDLKGKGEPAYTLEEKLKEQERLKQRSSDHSGVYEMQPTARTTGVNSKNDNILARERSASLDSAGPSTGRSKRLSDGIKRRIGSIRRKHDDV